MALPSTYKSFRRTLGTGDLTIAPNVESLPATLAATEVLIKIRVVSLNFRDVGMLHGHYPSAVIDGGIPASDAAAEVVAIGPAVTQFRVGDCVSPHFYTHYLSGDEDAEAPGQLAQGGLGGAAEGVLREYAVFDERQLVKLPAYLDWIEASTVACAGVTAWVALNGLEGLKVENSTVLLEGTGGVSMFALLLLVAAGIRTIITSSSDEKILAIKQLGPRIEGINYRTHPDVAAEVMRLTGGRGASLVVNNAGLASIPVNIASVAAKGTVSMVGFLDGFAATWDPKALTGLMDKRARLQGIDVGSKPDFAAVNQFLEEKKVDLKPLLDRTFSFDDSCEAFDYLYSGKHVGKVTVKVA